MATLTLEECRELAPVLKDLPDEQVIKIRDNLTIIVNTLLRRVLEDQKAKAVAGKKSKPGNPDK